MALLDPAVGAGNLIAPLAARLRRQCASVYCVDSDHQMVVGFASRLRSTLPEETELIHADFLDWSLGPRLPKFDCIVMYPLFAASKSDLRRLDTGVDGDEECEVYAARSGFRVSGH